MEHIYRIETMDLENKYIIEKTVTIKLSEEKYEEIKTISIEVDDSVEEILNCIVNKNLLDKIDDEDFKQLIIDAYYDDVFAY